MTTETRPVNKLKPHPLNDQIYNDTVDDDLIASIQEQGILNPLLITKSGVIISGHRRWQAAKKLGLVEVPVNVSPTTNKIEIERQLIHSNRHRTKTNEMQAREYKRLKEIETELALKRQKSGKTISLKDKKDLGEKLPKGRASDIAAKELGKSGKTLDKTLPVIDKIDKLFADGKAEEADAIRQKLNRSIDAAHKLVVTGPKKKVKSKETADEKNKRIASERLEKAKAIQAENRKLKKDLDKRETELLKAKTKFERELEQIRDFKVELDAREKKLDAREAKIKAHEAA
jgi:ParB family chromosome partitioning protein